MRVLCSTTAGEGHFGPLRALAQACRAEGHDVRVAAPASFAEPVARAGLTHEPFPDADAEAIGAVFAALPTLTHDEANRRVLADVFGRLDARAALPGLQAVIDGWRPDVVLREPAEFGALAAAEAAGIPHAEVATGVAALWDLFREPVAEPLDELGALVGLEAGRLEGAAFASPLFTTVPQRLDGAVPTSGSHPARTVVRYRVGGDEVGGRLPGSWGDPEAPLVYVTFGTVAGGAGQMGELFRPVLDALSDLPVRVLLTTGVGGWLPAGDAPANSHVEQFWPQDQVMPLAAAVVGHGGFGTTMTALAAGVPQVVVPLFASDQHLNAEAVSAAGAGVSLPGGPGALPDLAAAVTRVLSEPGFAAGAADVAAQIASLPDASEVVDVVRRLADTGTRWARGRRAR
jgi:UDP:flavonoid glycosyltransferase YjiC (YdhE family)